MKRRDTREERGHITAPVQELNCLTALRKSPDDSTRLHGLVKKRHPLSFRPTSPATCKKDEAAASFNFLAIFIKNNADLEVGWPIRAIIRDVRNKKLVS
jgi:hypothetical protein